MAEALKHLINAATLAHAASHLQRACSAFDAAQFLRTAQTDLDTLEFKARAMRLADGLEAALPVDFGAAADAIELALAPALPFDSKGEPLGLGAALSSEGLAGWVLWGVGDYVARSGMADVPRALACLHAITQRFTAEFAIRPFINQQPAAVFPILAQWASDPSAHVRRLVSEGSRPRLPWGLRLQQLVHNPAPALPLLFALQDDASAYVRRSVANHLNDIAKDHPDQVAQWVETHLRGASPARTALLRHASRSLIKQAHAPTLRAWGLGQTFDGQVSAAMNAKTMPIGGEIELALQLRSSSTQPQTLVVDYVVHHVRANASTSPKVFKGWKLTLSPGADITLTKRHSLRSVSTRQLYPGKHQIDIQINGQVVASMALTLLPTKP
ncbi:MAG: DNA alkylation repair protein [Hydrogenophaga sp.]